MNIKDSVKFIQIAYLLDDGTLSAKGLNIFSDAIKYIENNIDNIYLIYNFNK